MKKIFTTFSIVLVLFVTINTVTTVAQPKIYKQGFYTMKDLDLHENITYTVKNHEPYAEGLLIIVDSERKIQQLIRVQPSAFSNSLVPLKYNYNFIIYGDISLSFS